MLLSGPLDGVEKLEPIEVESVLGKLLCSGIKGTKAFIHESKSREYSHTATYRLHEKAPFGVVAAELESSVTRGEPQQSWTLKCRLVEHGTNADSSLLGSL